MERSAKSEDTVVLIRELRVSLSSKTSVEGASKLSKIFTPTPAELPGV